LKKQIAFIFLVYEGAFLKVPVLVGDRGSTVVKVLATNRKVTGSIPDSVIGIFHGHDPSDCTMALGSAQPLTEMSTRSISWG